MFIFTGLKGILPKIHGITIDNHVFQLHYRITVIALVAFIILLSAKEYIGEPIRCTTRSATIPIEIVSQFCWIQSTYSLPDLWHGTIGEDIIYPGVGSLKKDSTKVYHKYYQWVVFMLFLQAVLFYIPRYLWKMWEGGKMQLLVLGLDHPLLDANEKEQKIHQLSAYICKSRNTHNFYSFRFIFCEVLNMVNIVGQLFMTDRFLGHEFTSFGMKVLKFISTDQQNRTDPMSILFPRMTKCMFYQFGDGGSIENKDALCVLPLNIVNEKVYVFLWFWFMNLAWLTAANLVYRVVIMALPPLRITLIKMRSSLVSRKRIKLIVGNSSFGDWFLLYLLSKNIDPMIFKDLIEEICDKKENATNDVTDIYRM